MLNELVVATHNTGKIAEIKNLLVDRIEDLQFAGELGLEEAEENGNSFHENAKIKATAIMQATGKVALADDSGLAVNALNGEPGIYSARWAEDKNGIRNFNLAMEKLWHKIKDEVDKSAYFITVLALAFPDGRVEYIEGRVDGKIIYPPKGTNGFGYDPIFLPHGYSKSFAEMNREEKQKISHRGLALQKFIEKYVCGQ